MDNLQGDHFAMTFGNNLGKHSEAIEKVVKKRSAARARDLINFLQSDSHSQAAAEVGAVMQFHANKFREAGVELNLSELGF